jgi:hypothetical protein
MRPAQPFHDWPVDFFVSGMGFAWYRHDVCALVLQSVQDVVNTASADIMNDLLDHVVRCEQRAIARVGGLTVFCDFRSIQRFEAGTVQHHMRRVQKRGPGYLRKSMLVYTASESALVESALRTTSAFVGLVLGKSIQLITDVRAGAIEAGIVKTPRYGDLHSLQPLLSACSLTPSHLSAKLV